MAEREAVLGFAVEIISAHISKNTMRADQLQGLIQQVSTHSLPSSKYLSHHFSQQQQCR